MSARDDWRGASQPACSRCCMVPCACHRPPEPTVSVELTEVELSDLVNARFRMLAYERGIDKLQAALDKLRGEQ